MNKIVIIYLLPVWLLFTGCATVEKPNSSAKVDSVEKSGSKLKADDAVSDLHKRIYYFQHRLIRNWVFESNGQFYADLRLRDTSGLTLAATEIINSEYAKSILVTPIDNKEAVLISFPEPDSAPLCYFAIVEKTGAKFSYLTYEKALPFGEKVVGVVGSWSEDGGHGNHGPRGYKTAEEFIKDVLAP